jgi:hypothetical protein
MSGTSWTISQAMRLAQQVGKVDGDVKTLMLPFTRLIIIPASHKRFDALATVFAVSALRVTNLTAFAWGKF